MFHDTFYNIRDENAICKNTCSKNRFDFVAVTSVCAVFLTVIADNLVFHLILYNGLTEFNYFLFSLTQPTIFPS